MVVVDKKRVVHVESFMVKNDQEAKVDILLEGTTLNFTFVFKAGEGQTGSWSPVDDRTLFTFTGWSNPLDSLTRLNLHRLSQVFLRGDVGGVAP